MGSHGSQKEKGLVLVTGASAGIGRELALVFAEHGHDLVLVARTRSKLEALADEITERFGRRADVIAMDLTEDDAAGRLFAEIVERGYEVEVLVNNAGTGEVMKFHEVDRSVIDNILRLNVVSLTHLARLFVEPMVERGHGRILNVASVAAFQPTPRLSVYGATKAFVLSLTEALSVELADKGVTVSTLCPGFVDTDLVRHLGEELGQPDFVPSFLMLDPREVAREGYEACMRGEVVHISGKSYELVVQLLRLQPRWLVRTFTGFLSRRVG
jgi:short-subunit dehydrogenase